MAAVSATRKEEKKMKKECLFTYILPGRCEEKKWVIVKLVLSYHKILKNLGRGSEKICGKVPVAGVRKDRHDGLAPVLLLLCQLQGNMEGGTAGDAAEDALFAP